MKRSPLRRLLGIVRFAIAIPLLASVWQGKIELWLGFLLYVILWIIFIALDASIAFRDYQRNKK